ncbi:MAG: hypothetical protein HOF70_15535 [Rhodospirillaceae bacterium]|jgi:adenylate cyclase|nr:hypothetical protein [Rhodospirillaceae bacterium]MBT3886198.1 hypothetical protein [Rhodospirillaceae bacterium]MBT4116713.1 hypothetical protein [Rhodospirillaceae bacterium]MBT4671698.1 hypothetical protein [Rhodospirillaceae bacterium]MBT5840253.1 hypothetical protein [Rhodospirillaceae bacterium]
MADRENQRRLAAILAADVAGYTRQMEEDTDGTVAAWKAARDDVIDPAITVKSGTIIKFTGDGFLAEFPSVQDAVSCAIQLQEQLDAGPLEFRMGIHIGDVTDDGTDIHGEGVNIAARLEGLAEPGGICVSGDVFNQVRNRIEADFADMGEQEVKHVTHPIHVYAVKSGAKDQPVVQHPEKASIAVLPFDNLSNDPEQDYFVDGVVEDIITELSKFRWLMVIARNSTFTYKGQSVDIKTVGHELGARYVVEGSVRKAGNRIRINAQLIDSADGSHIWAERYDRELEDVFDLQDEITQTLVSTIEPELKAAEKIRARRKPTENLDAWEMYHKAMWHRYQFTGEGYDDAERLLEKALELDPNFAAAHALKAWLGYGRVVMGHTDDPKKSLAEAYPTAKQAVALDDRDANAFLTLGSVETLMGRYESALKNLDYAIELNPNFAQAHIFKGLTLIFSGSRDSAKTLSAAETGMRLSPKDPSTWTALNTIGCVQMVDGDLGASVATYDAACRLPVTSFFSYLHLAAALKLTGRDEEARTAMASALELLPNLTLAGYEQQVGSPLVAMLDEIGAVDAWRELGLPEK